MLVIQMFYKPVNKLNTLVPLFSYDIAIVELSPIMDDYLPLAGSFFSADKNCSQCCT